MTYTEILELIRAGYNKEEINVMMSDDPSPADAPKEPAPVGVPDQDHAQDPAPDPAPNQDPAPVPAPSEADKLAAALGLKLDSILKAVQTANVKTIEQAGNGTMTAEDVIAAIINPPTK